MKEKQEEEDIEEEAQKRKEKNLTKILKTPKKWLNNEVLQCL